MVVSNNPVTQVGDPAAVRGIGNAADQMVAELNALKAAGKTVVDPGTRAAAWLQQVTGEVASTLNTYGEFVVNTRNGTPPLTTDGKKALNVAQQKLTTLNLDLFRGGLRIADTVPLMQALAMLNDVPAAAPAPAPAPIGTPGASAPIAGGAPVAGSGNRADAKALFTKALDLTTSAGKAEAISAGLALMVGTGSVSAPALAAAAPAVSGPAPAVPAIGVGAPPATASSPAPVAGGSTSAGALAVGAPAPTPANPVTITSATPVGGSIANIDPVALELLATFAGTGPSSNVPMLIAASSLPEAQKMSLLDRVATIANDLIAVTVGNQPALQAAAAKLDKLADDLAVLFPTTPGNNTTNPLNVIAQNLSNAIG